MQYYVRYRICLKIAKKHRKEALRIFNYLHTDEMLEQYAEDKVDDENLPVSDRRWYKGVPNPAAPYETLEEAFRNWDLVEDETFNIDEEEDGSVLFYGDYDNPLRQQEFLLKSLAPVLKNSVIYVVGEDNRCFAWVIENGNFYKKTLTIEVDDDETETDDD